MVLQRDKTHIGDTVTQQEVVATYTSADGGQTMVRLGLVSVIVGSQNPRMSEMKGT